VALALSGAGLDRATVAFVGWFGPRGLASIVFGLIAVDALEPKEASVVLAAVTLTVTLSVAAHGLSASPLAARYGRYASSLHTSRPEHGEKPPLRARHLRAGGRERASPQSGSPKESPRAD
jgi:sodium/hydrogen antiporter